MNMVARLKEQEAFLHWGVWAVGEELRWPQEAENESDEQLGEFFHGALMKEAIL